MASLGFVLSDLARKGLKNRRFLEKAQAQNLQNVVQAPVELEFLFDDGDQDVSADGNPDLSFHGVVGGPIKCLDTQMLLGNRSPVFSVRAYMSRVMRSFKWHRETKGKYITTALYFVSSSHTFCAVCHLIVSITHWCKRS